MAERGISLEIYQKSNSFNKHTYLATGNMTPNRDDKRKHKFAMPAKNTVEFDMKEIPERANDFGDKYRNDAINRIERSTNYFSGIKIVRFWQCVAINYNVH